MPVSSRSTDHCKAIVPGVSRTNWKVALVSDRHFSKILRLSPDSSQRQTEKATVQPVQTEDPLGLGDRVGLGLRMHKTRAEMPFLA